MRPVRMSQDLSRHWLQTNNYDVLTVMYQGLGPSLETEHSE